MQAEFARAARLSVLGELTASIAYEINQPLAAIANSGAAGLRWINRASPDIEEIKECLGAVVEDVTRVSKIIGRIRATANGKPPEKTELDLDDVIEEALKFLRSETQERSVTVRHERSKALPKIFGDRTQIHQVIVNLAMNAIQATHDPGTRPCILIRSARFDGGTALCTVEDNGTGIEPDNADRLFESFFTTKEGGMGMGLRICQSIVEAHGGRISVDAESSLGGARFLVSIPAVAVADARRPEAT